MRRVLGIDPGPTHSGYCVLDFTVKSAPIWIEAGTSEDVGQLLELTFSPGPEMLVVVEQPRALHDPMANVMVMRTAWAGGEIYGYARAKGFNVLSVGVNEWRIAFVGHSRRGDNVDAKVKAELYRRVRQMPARTSVHARDAGGVAMVGADMWLAGHYSTPRAKELSSRIEPGTVTHIRGERA
jgi:hypothetical protein